MQPICLYLRWLSPLQQGIESLTPRSLFLETISGTAVWNLQLAYAPIFIHQFCGSLLDDSVSINKASFHSELAQKHIEVWQGLSDWYRSVARDGLCLIVYALWGNSKPQLPIEWQGCLRQMFCSRIQSWCPQQDSSEGQAVVYGLR